MVVILDEIIELFNYQAITSYTNFAYLVKNMAPIKYFHWKILKLPKCQRRGKLS